MVSLDPTMPGRGGPILVGVQRTTILAPAADYAEAFRRRRAIVCADLLDPALLTAVLDRCRQGQFAPDAVQRLGTREVESPARAGRVLNLALSRPALLRWVETVVGCAALGRVDGRVVQTRANGVDALDWHDDLNVAERRLGITVNLSDAAYVGGDFELRDVTTQGMLARYHHHAPGTALLFDVDAAIEHRVLPVLRGGPRRVFTGWLLRAEPR